MTEIEPPKTVELTCSSLDLSNGRKVTVGFNREEEDRSYYLLFMNQEGEETKVRVSEEAYNALISLKPHVDLRRDTDVLVKTLVVEFEAMLPPADGETLSNSRSE